jgi:hypothetical protein
MVLALRYLLLTLICLSIVNSNEIVDFTYSQYIQKDGKKTDSQFNINIKPEKRQSKDY